MIFVNWKSKVQQLQLSIVPVQKISTSRAILTGPSHVLPQSIKGSAFLSIPLWIIAIRLPNVVLQRKNPIDLVSLL